MFQVRDKVVTSKTVKAGIAEDGPKVYDRGIEGIVINIEPREPDGIHVRLANGTEWWFKPNQLEKK
tara:strand:+ start:512 stop:709 length:198 start_codon:yes stop_codon:yes gene_type:complete